MGRTICISSYKGGVGKTTTAVHLSTALSMAERKILLIDCDPQGHATAGVGMDKKKMKTSFCELMEGADFSDDIILETPIHGLDLIPSNAGEPPNDSIFILKPGGETVLKGLVDKIKGDYDFIVIDPPPAINAFSLNALIAAETLLIPLQCEFYAFEGMDFFFNTIKSLRRRFAPSFMILGILLTMFEEKETISRYIVRAAQGNFRDKVFKTIIPRSIELRESAIHGIPLLMQNIMSPGAQCYLSLAREILNGVQ